MLVKEVFYTILGVLEALAEASIVVICVAFILIVEGIILILCTPIAIVAGIYKLVEMGYCKIKELITK